MQKRYAIWYNACTSCENPSVFPYVMLCTFDVTTHPLTGTKTCRKSGSSLRRSPSQLILSRGQKLEASKHGLNTIHVTTHPLTGPKKRHAAASHCNMPLSYARTGPNRQPPTGGSFFVRKKCVLEQPVKQIQNDESPHGNPPLRHTRFIRKRRALLKKKRGIFYSSAPRHTPRFSCKRSRTSLSSMDAIHWEKSSSIIRAA